ncbi:M36 family metallopeptidase [Flavobacterium sp.]|uniref:M36 family metallopeptidase n=1 Tax=Flavobacterium sp. TaxID=239 RepID=UPI003D2B5ED2
MKKKHYLSLFFAVLSLLYNEKGFSQDDLKVSKYGDKIKKHLSLSKYELSNEDINNLYVDSEYLSKKTKITHVYVGQQFEGIKIYNAISSIAIKNDNVFYVGSSFVKNVNEKINTVSPIISKEQAIKNVALRFGLDLPNQVKLISSTKNNYIFDKGTTLLENIPVKLVFTYVDQQELKLSWDVSLYTIDGKHNWNARVDAVTGSIIEFSDLVISCDFGIPCDISEEHHHSKVGENEFSTHFFKKPNSSLVGGAEYRVYALPAESPNHAGRTLAIDPENLTASPFGWHDTNGISGPEYTITRGNNVHAYNDIANTNSSQGDEPDGGAPLSFDFTSNLALAPSTNTPSAQNLSSNTTNLFYMSNMMHDIWYAYGFDEASGNFQENNYGNGGIGGDYVKAEAQDGSGSNNANFSTPTDGGNGRMQMYLWTTPNPDKDGDLDNGIIAHEYGHGISTRLAGGPNNSGCLSGNEQQGEGWSDWFALMSTIEPGDLGTDGRGIGTYARNQPVTGSGIRTYRYSTNMAINPHTYDDIKTEAVPHGVGSVWCAMLWDLTWAYIDKYGFDPDLYNGTGGNNKVMQLVLDGLKLQPCGSGFVDSRDALLAADFALTGGDNQCLIWEVFARRGLGASAIQGTSASRSDGTEAFDLPLAYIFTNVTSNACGSDVVELTLSNLNVTSINQFDYNYTIDGGAPNSGTWSGTINSCSATSGVPFTYGSLPRGTHEIVITGTNPVTVPASFFVSVNDSGTVNAINTFTNTTDNLVAYDDTGNATWERGDAYAPGIGRSLTSTIAGGSKVYGTNLDGIHGDGAKFYLISQCYDLSLLKDTFVRFDLAFDIEQDWDLLYLEYSTDSGITWNNLGTSSDINWYNSSRLPNGIDCFNCIGAQWTGEAADATTHTDGGTVGTMHNYSHTLSAFDSTGSAETSIVFRFTYHADEAYAEEGALIDNFVVEGVPNPLSLEDNNIQNLVFYPNPTNDILNIKSDISLQNSKITLYDITGRVLSNKINIDFIDDKSIIINVSNLADGNYFFTIETEDNNTLTKRFIKN